MNNPEASFSVAVDVTNPGQFFACCGVLELAHRLWPGAEGWFSARDTSFNVRAPTEEHATLTRIVTFLDEAGIQGDLSNEERSELDILEARRRAASKEGRKLQERDEQRRIALGKRQREGALTIRQPFDLRVDWWQEDGEDVPKTFAGRQEVLRMVRAMLVKTPEAAASDRPLAYRCQLQAVADDSQDAQGSRSQNAKVEPFYFDAFRFAHPLDAGFSLDVQEQTLRATAAPVTELFALIGLQRSRPATADERWAFQYWTWTVPLSPAVAASVVCGAAVIASRNGYRFQLRFRDDQKRYKAFGFSTPMTGAR